MKSEWSRREETALDFPGVVFVFRFDAVVYFFIGRFESFN